MTFLAPGFLWAGVAFSLGIVALHFIVTRQPKSEDFPTARFVPASSVEAVSRSQLPTDLFLLLLRVLAVLSVASALARPVLTVSRNQNARIVLADLSLSSAKIGDVRDSVSKYFRPNDVLVAFDSSARVYSSPDSFPSVGVAPVGNLSAALIASLRSARKLRDQADSISLVVVSSLPSASWDAATDTLRAMWPGAIQVVRVAARNDSSEGSVRKFSSELGSADPLRFGLALASDAVHTPSGRLVRTGKVPSPDDGEIILHWPSSERPAFSSPAPATTHAGLVAGSVVQIASFTTHFEFTPDSARGARVVARWLDGAPAAIQRNVAGGCVRSVNIAVPQKGDLAIRPEFVAIVSQLISPCAFASSPAPLPDSVLAQLKGGNAAAARSAFAGDDEQTSPFTPWLLLAALMLLGLEQLLRRNSKRFESAAAASPVRSAA